METINKEYFHTKDAEVKKKKSKLPTLEAIIQGRTNVIKEGSSSSEEDYSNETRLVVIYNVIDPNQATQLYSYQDSSYAPKVIGVNLFDNVEIDKKSVSISDIDAAGGNYQLSVGKHIVKYTLKDPTVIADLIFLRCYTIEKVFIPNTVKTITPVGHTGSFEYCINLQEITIPSSVTSINQRTFFRCYFNNFVNNSDLDEISNNYWGATIINSDENGFCIKNGELYNYRYKMFYTDIVIPDNVTSIGQYVFDNCTHINSVIIPDSVTSIGDHSFSSCSGLTSITIPNSVTTIGNYAFDFCSGLTSITIGSSVTTIGQQAFRYCRGLTSVTIPNSVTSISNNAFDGCSSLISVDISNSVTNIGNNAFIGCTSLTSVVIPNSVTSIGSYAFSGCSGLTSVTLPNSVTSIGNCMFQNCSSLTSVIIPNSVTSIGNSSFVRCSSLTSVTIGDNVNSIGERTFCECSSLTDITIPSSVISIGKEAFKDCSNLTSIICNATTAPSIISSTFQGVKTNGTLTVPAGSNYNNWMKTTNYYLGKYNWTKIEQ